MALTPMIFQIYVFAMTILFVGTLLLPILPVVKVGLGIGNSVWNRIDRFFFSTFWLTPFRKLCDFVLTIVFLSKISVEVTMALTSTTLRTDILVMMVVLVSAFLFLLFQVVKIGLWIGDAFCKNMDRFFVSALRLVPFPRLCKFGLTFVMFFKVVIQVTSPRNLMILGTDFDGIVMAIRMVGRCLFLLFYTVKLSYWFGDTLVDCMDRFFISNEEVANQPICTPAPSKKPKSDGIDSMYTRCFFRIEDVLHHLRVCPPAPSKKPKSDGINSMDARCFFRIEDVLHHLRVCPPAPVKKPKSNVLTLDASKPLVLFPPTTEEEDQPWEHQHEDQVDNNDDNTDDVPTSASPLRRSLRRQKSTSVISPTTRSTRRHQHEDQVDNHQQNDENTDNLPTSASPLRRSLRLATKHQKSTSAISTTTCSTRRSDRLASKTTVRYCNMCWIMCC